MGCDETREDIEESIVYARLERDQIRRERKILTDKLRLLTGEEYKSDPIPDYIDIEYIREKKRKQIEKQVKKAVKEEEERKKKEEIKKKQMEEELKRIEREGYDEEFIYQPLNLKIKNKNLGFDDVYFPSYVLEKKEKNKQKEDEEEKDESKDTKNKKKSNLKKNKKVKFNENVNENTNDDKDDNENNNDDDNENNEIDNDIIQKVDVKIDSKTASVVRGFVKNSNTIKKASKNNIDKDDDSKNAPYFTPHLQPND